LLLNYYGKKMHLFYLIGRSTQLNPSDHYRN